MAEVRRGAAVVVVVVAALFFFACSDEAPSTEAVAEAEEVALAALLVEGDLLAGDWEVTEFNTEQLREAAPPAGGDSLDECGESPESGAYDAALAVRARNLVSGGPGAEAITADSIGVGMIVSVFESEEALLEAIGAQRESVNEVWFSDECEETFPARTAAVGFESRVEEPHYGLPDAKGIRITTVVTTSTGASEMTIETHYLVRGRIMGIYSAINGDAGGIDHQGLLEAFEARVVAVQE